eukprot:837491_1
MGGVCCGCDAFPREESHKPEASSLISKKNTTKREQNPFNKNTELKEEKIDIETTEEWGEYKNMMKLVFYTFAGYSPWAKKTGLYMHERELGRFLEIVNINDPVEAVFKLIDTDIQDGKLTFNEWMDYFTNKNINTGIYAIKQHLEEQVTW